MITSTRIRATIGNLLAMAFLLAAIAASLMLTATPAQATTTFTVNSTANHIDQNLAAAACDTGYTVTGAGGEPENECTLRAAIEQANYTPGADTINFNIPGSDVKTIAPTTALPKITEAVTINGYSQPGAHPNTKAIGSDALLKIELSGASSSGGDGLWITASNSTVKGLVINRWNDAGIELDGSGATGNKVVGNFIGTDPSGTQKLGNYLGILSAGSNNTVGGTTAAERNVVSGNILDGVRIYGPNAMGNKVAGNYIGTDPSGTKDLGNSNKGVYIYEAKNNTVGGATAGERNVISGNNSDGVRIIGSGASGNKVAGNYVGTDKNGTAALGNGGDGVYIKGAPNNTVGGTTIAERNVISHNGYGVFITDDGASGNRVMQNIISANEYAGVGLYGDTATGNRILSNSIFTNGDLGIDLNDDGSTANDPGDADTGANDLQNKPVLSSAKKSSTGTTTVKGNLNSTPGKTFNVQFFSNPEGTNEGKTFLGSASVTTNGTGNVSFSFSTKKTIRLGQNITATTTNTSTGNTSEFSGPRKVVAL
jgi:hypothetical protein